LDRNVLLAEEEVGDGEGAGEGDGDWQSTDVKGLSSLLLSWEVTVVERLATTARRRRARPWRWLDEDDDGMSCVRARR